MGWTGKSGLSWIGARSDRIWSKADCLGHPWEHPLPSFSSQCTTFVSPRTRTTWSSWEMNHIAGRSSQTWSHGGTMSTSNLNNLRTERSKNLTFLQFLDLSPWSRKWDSGGRTLCRTMEILSADVFNENFLHFLLKFPLRSRMTRSMSMTPTSSHHHHHRVQWRRFPAIEKQVRNLPQGEHHLLRLHQLLKNLTEENMDLHNLLQRWWMIHQCQSLTRRRPSSTMRARLMHFWTLTVQFWNQEKATSWVWTWTCLPIGNARCFWTTLWPFWRRSWTMRKSCTDVFLRRTRSCSQMPKLQRYLPFWRQPQFVVASLMKKTFKLRTLAECSKHVGFWFGKRFLVKTDPKPWTYVLRIRKTPQWTLMVLRRLKPA